MNGNDDDDFADNDDDDEDAYHSGGERSLGETKYIIGDSYIVGLETSGQPLSESIDEQSGHLELFEKMPKLHFCTPKQFLR